ncbi:transcriptional repressor, LexA family [Melioribacter roseus P3M-2]|uniref:LexA repressor n=1 Tax=Melioribacter roseus (strain DSM 23840 / JCM 17771 / VKM B-2668 / P3M-2) TaxID=1191523 RepID=I7A5R4_MELRP|nr:transcriptional repressor LexA [Melioribacter roseus]AFN75241.1 transcriptional repressor, LexA family [Melioribacter roseus P3M-2]
MKKENITNRQKEILDFIQDYVDFNGYPPTYREIGKHFNIASTFGVKRHIDALIKKGYLSNESGASRTLSLIVDNAREKSNSIIDIPIVGRVAAGAPILAEENIEGNLSLDKNLVGNRTECFGLKVRGDSMINAGILEGDLVIIQPQREAQNGDIIVALLHDEATMKRFQVVNDKIYLIPENDNYEPIVVDNPEEFTIIGKVVGVFRSYH